MAVFSCSVRFDGYEIEQHKESQERYWAREVVWAANQVKINRLTNMRRKDFEACLPYVADYATKELTQQIKGLSHMEK